MTESVVQVAPDSSGKKVRTLEVSEVQSDVTIATTEMQVVVLADSDGIPIDFSTLADLVTIFGELLCEVKDMKLVLYEIISSSRR